VQRLAGSPNIRGLVWIRSPEELRSAIDNQRVIVAVSIDQRFSADIEAGRPATIQAVFDGRRSNAAPIVFVKIWDTDKSYDMYAWAGFRPDKIAWLSGLIKEAA